MTTAIAAQCRKCEASALHLITERDIYGEYEKCLQCGEVQADKVVGDWPDTDDATTRVGWGWQTGVKKQPQFITFQLCIPGSEWRKKSDVAFLEIEYHPLQDLLSLQSTGDHPIGQGLALLIGAHARLGQRCARRERHSEPRRAMSPRTLAKPCNSRWQTRR